MKVCPIDNSGKSPAIKKSHTQHQHKYRELVETLTDTLSHGALLYKLLAFISPGLGPPPRLADYTIPVTGMSIMRLPHREKVAELSN
jgi:hypothetical protein